jgi:hypothetical protein
MQVVDVCVCVCVVKWTMQCEQLAQFLTNKLPSEWAALFVTVSCTAYLVLIGFVFFPLYLLSLEGQNFDVFSFSIYFEYSVEQ